ncbi:killer cell lectin-like receptor subfamily G member 1 isoform X2 [Papio anubis]|uniref:killer cell lectin-like receptor subfamily G member 1 isoform X2 n=1 Tax=Papio anubis TaxID=9555 RepID=UPI000B7AFD45|nr:killer cell lectin-like receptor subfamily G member 1 isoform X2 [Papio anubis]XP_031517151.1 killer cell lectin-like receptor subfamily G member 1 isoform X2 [Papio anubis]XP_031517522.1 killer cell lectin-like receptor subfamily G member 1 isoform X2 [Papio anubis]
MTDSVIYSMLELPTATQAQNDYGPQQKSSSSRPSCSCLVAIALGLLTAVLMSVLLYQWILCQGSKYSTCASCPSCPDHWMKYVLKAGKSNIKVLWLLSLLQDFLSEAFHWVGLRNNSGWRWEDGSPLNFSRIYSNSLVQTCGAINKNSLQASSCEVPLQWVCKKVRP